MAGRVTVAHDIKGERVGQTAHRVWTFTPLCPAGMCQTLALVRKRARGSDSLTLSLTGPGSYRGRGLFYAPLRCGRRTYPKGEAVPFTIIVHVTAAAVIEGVDVATTVYAEYINRARRNLTRCVEVPGHDAAQYSGILMPPSSGGAAPLSDRSPAGS
jgi:hypothetical protein